MTKKIKTAAFTLVELLIVIAIIGALAVVLFVAINPTQQLAKTRDSGRISGVSQLGQAAEAFAVSNNGVYMAEGATWISAIVTAGEMSVVPSAITYAISGVTACTTNAQNSYCYDASDATGTEPIVIYSRLESTNQNSACSGTDLAWAVYSSADGRAGTVCSTTEPVNGSQTFEN